MSSGLKRPIVPLFLPSDGPLDAEYVDSLWLDACISAKNEAAMFLLAIRNGLLGVNSEPRAWNLKEVLAEINDTFGEGRAFGTIENILLTMQSRGECFRGSKVAFELAVALIREMVVESVPDAGSHHEPFALH